MRQEIHPSNKTLQSSINPSSDFPPPTIPLSPKPGNRTRSHLPPAGAPRDGEDPGRRLPEVTPQEEEVCGCPHPVLPARDREQPSQADRGLLP